MTKGEKKILNKLLHEFVELRDGAKCLRCGNTQGLALSHIYPKGRYRSMEFEEDNLKLLDYKCHICFWHKNPIEAHEWLISVMPPARLQRLKLMAQGGYKAPTFTEKKLWLEQEIKRIKKNKLA